MPDPNLREMEEEQRALRRRVRESEGADWTPTQRPRGRIVQNDPFRSLKRGIMRRECVLVLYLHFFFRGIEQCVEVSLTFLVQFYNKNIINDTITNKNGAFSFSL